ncbi:MAG: NAD(P)/FAD-dependent oxidoreductase [Actinomycetia bacterium]|nr:NAD(P)/FAD-dependent oxidoreductase [Actinomycetes bacterium]
MADHGDSTSDETWDVVVVGSGPGGLTAAACLAAEGRRVLVLEAHDLAGGNTQVFRRHHKVEDGSMATYEFDVGIHYIGDCGPGGLFPSIFTALGVGDRIDFRPLDPDGFDTLHFPDLDFSVPVGWDRYRDRLVEAFPSEQAGLERVVGVLREVAEESRARSIPGAETPTFDHWAFRTLDELFAEGELSQRAQAVLDHWSGLYAGGPSQTAVSMHAAIIDHYMRGAYYPEGGGQMMPARLIQVIEAFGGEVRTLAPVDRIIVQDRRATGVLMEDGRTVHATEAVISNADHARTVFGLVGEQHWDPGTVSWTREAQMTLGLVCVYLVVDMEVAGPNTNHFVFPTYETDGLYAELDNGILEGPDMFAYIAMASRKDPGNELLCSAGQTNLQVMTLAPRGLKWWGVEQSPADGGRYRRGEQYRARKAQLTDALIDAAQRALAEDLGGQRLRDHIAHVETATPLSQERYTRSTGGTSYGYIHSPEQSGENRPQHRTEIDGLWLVGANTSSGHGVAGTMVGGVNCAGEMLGRPLLIEMVLGTPLVDPADVPADPVGFDAMEFSRGAALRAERERGRAARAAVAD